MSTSGSSCTDQSLSWVKLNFKLFDEEFLNPGFTNLICDVVPSANYISFFIILSIRKLPYCV